LWRVFCHQVGVTRVFLGCCVVLSLWSVGLWVCGLCGVCGVQTAAPHPRHQPRVNAQVAAGRQRLAPYLDSIFPPKYYPGHALVLNSYPSSLHAPFLFLLLFLPYLLLFLPPLARSIPRVPDRGGGLSLAPRLPLTGRARTSAEQGKDDWKGKRGRGGNPIPRTPGPSSTPLSDTALPARAVLTLGESAGYRTVGMTGVVIGGFFRRGRVRSWSNATSAGRSPATDRGKNKTMTKWSISRDQTALTLGSSLNTLAFLFLSSGRLPDVCLLARPPRRFLSSTEDFSNPTFHHRPGKY
jgi:hypothetical protein